MRLIDADALKKSFCEWCGGSAQGADPDEVCGKTCATLDFFDEQPTIEAEPVRHGKLLEGKAFNDQYCSVCGQMFHDEIIFILPSDENGFHMPKRCPECGCYWDGGDGDATY